VKRKLGVVATVGLLAAALALALTACGGSDDADGVASLTDTTGQSDEGSGGGNGSGAGTKDWEQATLDYAKCMREHGVDFPDPVNGRFELKQRAGEEQKTKEAENACRPILDQAKPPPIDEGQLAEAKEAALDYAKCMREHGVDMPDPQFNEDGGMTQMAPEGAEDDPDFKEAEKACQPILQAGRSGGQSGQGEGS
jgi:hypothetical protein